MFFLAFGFGYYFGRGGAGSEIADAQSTIDELTVSVSGLNEAVKRAGNENARLRTIYETDRGRIEQLEETNIQLTESHQRTAGLVEKQRQLIEEITGGSDTAGRTSSEITEGLREAVQTINGIIKNIQERED